MKEKMMRMQQTLKTQGQTLAKHTAKYGTSHWYLTVLAFLILFTVIYFHFKPTVIEGFSLGSNNFMITNIGHDIENPSLANFLMIQMPTEVDPHIWSVNTMLSGVESEIEKIEFFDYFSPIGLHGTVQGLISWISPMSLAQDLRIIYALYIALFVALFLIILQQLDRLLGLNCFFIFTMLTTWFAVDFIQYGANLYWAGWSLLLPFAVSLLCLNTQWIAQPRAHRILFWANFSTILLKCLCCYEFISTIMVLAMLPFVFYVWQNKKSLRDGIVFLLYPALGALAAFAAAIVLQVLQQWICGYEFTEIIERVVGIITDRTDTFEGITRWDIFSGYLKTDIFVFNHFHIRVVDLLVLGVLNTIFTFFHRGMGITQRAFSIMTLVSLVAPISWVVLASRHAGMHTLHCRVLWYLPCIFLVGYQCIMLGKTIHAEKKAPQELTV